MCIRDREDLVLKLTELDIDTCWMTFTDSDKIKKALSLATPLEVAEMCIRDRRRSCYAIPR